jgi:hypothetical protein
VTRTIPHPLPAVTPRTMAGIIADAQPCDCGSCWARPLQPCDTVPPGGTHIARLARAVRRGRITAGDLALALAGFDVFTGASVVHP